MQETILKEDNRVNIKDFTLPEMSEFFKTLGEPAYRARQAAEWIFKKGVTDFMSMTNISLELKKKLSKNAYIGKVLILKKQVSSRYGTVKYLMGLDDGQTVETVLMKHSYGHSVCISTQVGCSMGCAMCASALGGKVRNLSSGEMYGQIQAVQEDSGERVSHVVLMGTGEPLDNYKSTVDFLININADYGYNIGYRHITLSTCGLVPKIRELAELGFPITLAVSLHGSGDAVRNTLMPINKKYPLAILLDACRYYVRKTGRRVTFEYAMLKGVNDNIVDAEKLAALLRGFICHVNIIPYNPVSEKDFQRSSPSVVKEFKEYLEKAGIEVTIRRELGGDIDAACGQLRRRRMFSYTS